MQLPAPVTACPVQNPTKRTWGIRSCSGGCHECSQTVKVAGTIRLPFTQGRETFVLP
jgi:hypothetical protein